MRKIYHRKDGRYEGRIDEITADGIKKYISVYGRTADEVKAKLNAIKTEKQALLNDETSSESREMTIKELFYSWLEVAAIRIKESSLANYRMKIERHIIPKFGDLHYLVNIIKGKGGKFRYARVLPKYESYIKRLREKYISEGRENERLFEDIPKRLEAHRYRGDYAKALYSIIARDVKSIPPKERYCMRGDRKGEVLDKVAMYVASRNLGHNRIDVIARNYLY